MNYEAMDKAELVDLLHELDERKRDIEQAIEAGNRFSQEFYESLASLACRNCLGDRYEEADPSNPTGKLLKWKGQRLIGTELPCRFCTPLRKILVGPVPFPIFV